MKNGGKRSDKGSGVTKRISRTSGMRRKILGSKGLEGTFSEKCTGSRVLGKGELKYL